MILHVRGGSFEEEFRCLKYDTNQVIRQLAESGLSEYAPIWSAVTQQLLIGDAVAHGTVLERAMELCRLATGNCRWTDVPEEYMVQAFEELIGH